jgi:hypothetical protein
MSARVIRLRPVVHASPTPNGLHVRGWASGFTVKGGTGIWKLWQRLAPMLTDGVATGDFGVPPGTPAPAAAALELLFAQLREHDMLVEVPASWPDIADAPSAEITRWLESVAPDPEQTWERLRAARILVSGEGPLAAAAVRAIAATGLTAATEPGTSLVLTAGDFAVAAGCSAEAGFVLHPGHLSEVLLDAVAVPARLGIDTSPPPDVLAALVGSAAAHRLLCAIGGLPDPAGEFVTHTDEVPADAPQHAVLVARLDPLRATYHPWIPAARPAPPATDPRQALAALTDAELGRAPVPTPGALPQLPANIVQAGDTLGVGTTLDGAKLDATVRALSRPGLAAGLDRTHALGNALRAAVRSARAGLPALTLSEEDWSRDATARRWWKALTLRFGVPAAIEVTRLGEAVVHAEIRDGERVLAWAVEAEPADAVAFAALAATGVVQAGSTNAGGELWLSGAAPLAPGADVPWVTREWHWPADVRDRETSLQTSLFELLGLPSPPIPLDAEGFVRCPIPVPAVAR